MYRDARIFVAGHRGLGGSAVLRKLQADGFTAVLTATRDQLALRDQAAVNDWCRANRPEDVILVAGIVGGIPAKSTRPATLGDGLASAYLLFLEPHVTARVNSGSAQGGE